MISFTSENTSQKILDNAAEIILRGVPLTKVIEYYVSAETAFEYVNTQAKHLGIIKQVLEIFLVILQNKDQTNL